MYDPKLNEPFIHIPPVGGRTLRFEAAMIFRYTKTWLGKTEIQEAKNWQELAYEAYKAAWQFIQDETGLSPEYARPNAGKKYPCPEKLAQRAKW